VTYRRGTVTFGYPSFSTWEEAGLWAESVYALALDAQKRMNAILAEARKAKQAAVSDLALGEITDPVPAPLDASTLRDDLADSVIPSIEARLDSIQTAMNAVLATLRKNGLLAS